MTEIPKNEEHQWAAGLDRIRKAIESRTPEQIRQIEQETAERNESIKQGHIHQLRQDAGIPVRHLQCAPGLDGDWAKKLELLSGKLGTGFTAVLIGVRGTGKTQMAVEIVKAATGRMMTCRFITAVGFFMEIKKTYRKEADDSEVDILQRYRRPKLLVIDEIGKRSDSDWENSLLFELLNKRYNDMTDTLLIDNRSKADFSSAIGPSLASRINESGGIIECNWESFR